jgi:hypothetical protein
MFVSFFHLVVPRSRLCYAFCVAIHGLLAGENEMTANTLKEQLQQQLELLPDDILVEIADFTAFILTRRNLPVLYQDWSERQWQAFTLQHFLREPDDVEYTLEDDEEVYGQ